MTASKKSNKLLLALSIVKEPNMHSFSNYLDALELIAKRKKIPMHELCEMFPRKESEKLKRIKKANIESLEKHGIKRRTKTRTLQKEAPQPVKMRV